MKKFGLFGEKLSHSMSPDIFKILFNKYDINGTYSLFEIKKENFAEGVSSAKVLGIDGVNVTIPYKVDVISQLDEVDESVKKIGACNCVDIKDGKTKGFNTDYYGVLKSLNYHNVDVKGKDCVILGSGGASKSVIALLKDLEAKSIVVVQREKTFEDSGIVRYIDYKELEKVEKGYLIVNTTPVGMYPKTMNSPVDSQIINRFDVCFDAVYNPIETKFLSMAMEQNKIAINGLYMLVGQGIEAFSIFNNIEVCDEDFLNVYLEVEKLLKEKI